MKRVPVSEGLLCTRRLNQHADCDAPATWVPDQWPGPNYGGEAWCARHKPSGQGPACPDCAHLLSRKSQRLGECQRADCGSDLEVGA